MRDTRIAAIAADCVSRFEHFCDPLEQRRVSLNPDDGRFYISLTTPSPERDWKTVRKLGRAARIALARLHEEPLLFDAITVFEESKPDKGFHIVHRSLFLR